MRGFLELINAPSARRITVGKSGAEVYDLGDGRVAKHVRRAVLDEQRWQSYLRESLFYSELSGEKYDFLPEIYHNLRTDDEIQLVMKKYRPLERERLDNELLDRVMRVLARIHSLPVPTFLRGESPEPQLLGDEDIKRCCDGWREVLDEHGGFPLERLAALAEGINDVNARHFDPTRRLCHGDFHFDNLLADENGKIVVCDWQGASQGHVSGDVSFLLSRLSADGYAVDAEQVVAAYCRYAESVSPADVARQMRLANLNTSFLFWHLYLHGADADTVHGIFDKMIEDFEALRAF